MLKKVINFFKKQTNIRYIALGFLAIIFLGSGLLMIPGVYKKPIGYINALYTSTSAVCVTGLIAVDTFDCFNTIGQIIVMLLIQIGGLGVTTLGAGLILAIRHKVNLKERNIIQESLNVEDTRGLLALFKRVFLYTFVIEFVGACLSLISFSKHYSIGEAIFKSVFHSIASFNNAGFDILGGLKNLLDYRADVLLNIVTMLLIILGGLGFLVISDIIAKKGKFKKLTLQSKIVITMTVILLICGSLLIKLTERDNITWLGAIFTSTSSRTAGFSTFSLGNFSNAGLLVVIVLMFIGASPGSTGGGIKTTTFFVIYKGIVGMVTHKSTNAYKYSINRETVRKAFVVTCLAISVIVTSTFIVCMIERNNTDIRFIDILFEMTSAFGTVGLSTGITTKLLIGSKIISIIMMYIGRVGPLTIVSLWYSGTDEYFQYSEGVIPIG